MTKTKTKTSSLILGIAFVAAATHVNAQVSAVDLAKSYPTSEEKTLDVAEELKTLLERDELNAAGFKKSVLAGSIVLNSQTVQQQVIDGLSYIIAKKSQDQFISSFIVELQETFDCATEKGCKQRATLLRGLFPNFYSAIQEMDPITYKAYLPTLRASILEDFNQLPFQMHMAENAGLEPSEALMQAVYSYKLLNTDQLNSEVDVVLPEVLLPYLTVSYENELLDATNSTDLRFAVGNEVYGPDVLAYMDIKNDGKTNFAGSTIKEFFDFLTTIDRYNANKKRFEKRNTVMIDPADYYEQKRAFSEVVLASSDFASGDEFYGEEVYNYFNTLIDIQEACEFGKYNFAVVKLIPVLAELVGENSDLNQDFYNILILAANLAEVETARDALAAFEAFSDPVEIYEVKRNPEGGRFNTTINGYAGYIIGLERISGHPLRVHDPYSIMHSLFLPIGAEFSMATGNNYISSLGIFLAPIDLGALGSYRLKDGVLQNKYLLSNTETIGYGRIFSPSVNLSLGITKEKPITAIVGYRYAPEHRLLINTLTQTKDILSMNQFYVGLSMDLALFNF